MSENGIIFDIQRLSLHDGPGIRTTVFFKGCPLSCLWCHNPESKKKQIQLSFQKNLCTNCKNCENSCPLNLHSFVKNIHQIDFSQCIACSKCLQNCPNNCLSLIGYDSNATNIMDIVLKDMDYYESSGGGITISGGEPLFQCDFLVEILQKAKNHKLHVCVETCGFASQKNFEKVLDFVDLFLFDFKHYDETQHIKYTGVSLKPIMDNLSFLDKIGAKVVLRCPIIPDINDTNEHFKAIADLSFLQCVQAVQLMPYHTMGVKKAENIGADYTLSTSFVTKETSEKYFQILKDYNCQKLDTHS